MIGTTNNRARAGAVTVTVLATTLLVGNLWWGGGGAFWFKMAASTGFLATALASGALHGNYGRAILGALIFCWWGDYFLTGNSEFHFLLGLGAFLLGHLAFSLAFALHGMNPKWCIAVGLASLVPAALVYHGLAPKLGAMATPVCAYIIVISLMVTFAAGAFGQRGTPLILLGAMLFYASDLFVARQKFASPSPWNPTIGLSLYYAAQICLAASIAPVAKSPAPGKVLREPPGLC